jgi:hypothetical protein
MYALPCPCGETIPVSHRQAGNEVTCPACGHAQPVPTLGALRRLPSLETGTASESASDGDATGIGKRLTFAGFGLVGGLAFLLGLFCLTMAATIEVESTTEAHIANDLERLQETSPARVTALYRDFIKYRLTERNPFPYQEHANAKAAWNRRGIAALVVAGLTVLAAVLVVRCGRRTTPASG